MKKQKRGRKFNRNKQQRKALLRSLAHALIIKERIETTQAKAKELSSFIEKKITKAKKADLSAIRYLAKDFSRPTVKKLVEKIAPLYQNRNGGYTRIIKTGVRQSDASKMAIIEFVKNGKKNT
jgi:large subunit ribosomal protein L17